MLKLFRVGVSGTRLVAHPTNAYPKHFEHLNYNVLSLKNVSMYIVVHVDKHLQKLGLTNYTYLCACLLEV